MWFLIKSDSVGVVLADGAIKLYGWKSRVRRCNDERNEYRAVLLFVNVNCSKIDYQDL
jgi:hypothetical protein